EGATCDAVGQCFDQVRGLTFEYVLDNRSHRPVVHRVIDAIGAPRAPEIRLDLDVDPEGLRAGTLGGADPVAAFEDHALKHDSVHRLIVAPGLDSPLVEVDPRAPGIKAADATIRSALESDLEKINDLYNEYVRDTH